MLQSLSQAYDIIYRITEPPVEINHARIGRPNLQIDLRATFGAKQPFSLIDDGPCKTVALMFGSDRQIIEPAAMSLVASHHTCDNLVVEQANQKQVGPHAQLAVYIFVRIVPGANQVTSPPKRNNRRLIFPLEWSNFHERFSPSDE
jgi:hypothetical protein